MPVSFVLGSGRSGSTLVHEVLCRHPAVGFVSNLEDRFGPLARIGRYNRTIYDAVPNALTRKGRARFAPSEAYDVLTREVSPMLVDPMRDLTAADLTPWLATRLERFFRGRADAQGCATFLHKFTGWPRSGLLGAAFPEARFVHVVRDGRAVANSWLQMEWFDGHRGPDQWLWGPLPPELHTIWESEDRSFVALAGLGWNVLMDAFEQARASIAANRWLDVCFEELVEDPGTAFARILAFYDLDATDPVFRERLASYDFSTSRLRAFEDDLGPDHLAVLDRVCGPQLRAWGYA